MNRPAPHIHSLVDKILTTSPWEYILCWSNLNLFVQPARWKNTPMLNPIYVRLPFAIALIFAFTTTAGTQPASTDRILGSVEHAQTAEVTITPHPNTRPQFDQGRTDTTRSVGL